jgi:hypothetical protein
MSELFERSVCFFVASMCFYGMTVYHVQWLMKIDEEQYKKQKEKDKQDEYRKLFSPVLPFFEERRGLREIFQPRKWLEVLRRGR